MSAGRVLAIDYGTKRIGVAVSDELGWTAQPLATYRRRSLNDDLTYLRDLVQEYVVREVVIGLPVRTNGDLGPEAHAVELFRQRLQAVLAVPVVTWDERYTTQSAEAVLLEADVSRTKRKLAVDRIAAAILLQDYLASQAANSLSPEPQEDDRDEWANPLGA